MPTRPVSARSAALKSKTAQRTAARSAAKSGTKPKAAKASCAPPSAEPSRILIAENGRIAYVSAGIAAALKTSPDSLKGQMARDVFSFTDPEDALHDRPGLGGGVDNADAWTCSVLPGDHEAVLRVGEQEKTVLLHFDRFSLPDGRTFLIATESSPNKKGAAGAKDTDLTALVAGLVASNPPSAPEKPKRGSKPKTAAIPETGYPMGDDLPVLLDMSHDLMMLMDRDGNLLRANDAFLTTVGHGADDIAHLNFLDLIHPDDRPHIRPIFRSLMRSDDAKDGRLIAFECRIRTKGDSVRWLECRQKQQGDKIYAVCTDMTDIKTHEAELIQRQRQLSEAQSIGRMGHWIWRIGRDEVVFSDEIYRIFGVTPDKFTPTIDSINSMLHRRDVGRMGQAFQRAMIEQRDYEMEFRIIRPDGQSRYILLQGRCEMDEESDVSALFGIMQDVTERVQHERELRDAKESAERAYAAKSQFLANMSHELRTPLNAIIGFSEMMQRQLLGPIGTPKYLDYIGGIRESGEHLLDLISDILDMSKIEAGKYELDIEEFNLYKVMRLAAHMIEGRALDAQVKVFSDVPEDLDLYVTGDRRAIMQVVLNLLSNAVKFTEPGGEVKISCVNQSDFVTIKVSDTGIGIPASKLRYVMKPFEQAANHFTRGHEGSGLGLAITKDLVELHGGNIHMESAVGIGTSVTIRLPYVAKKPE
jgi:two-component system cell cycle sensor histidine kinase PleC